MSKITEQQLIQSARRLKTIVKEDSGAEPKGAVGGAVAGAGLGFDLTRRGINRGIIPNAAGVIKIPPETYAKFGGWYGKIVGSLLAAVAGMAGGSMLGRKIGQMADDTLGLERDWGVDKLGLAGCTFTPDWRVMGVNKYPDDTQVQLDPASGLWRVMGTSGGLTGTDDRIRDTTQWTKLSMQALQAMATGTRNVEPSEPRGGWNVKNDTHLKILSDNAPDLRDRIIDRFEQKTPFDKKSTLIPPYKPVAANNPPPPPEPRVTSSGWPGAQ